jgi:hypothetical protein
VHWTLGILRDLRAFFWLRVFFCSQAESTPAPAPVTQTVGRSLAENKSWSNYMNNSEHTHWLAISWWIGNILIGSFMLFILFGIFANSAKDIFSGKMGFSDYLEIIFLIVLLLPFSAFLLISSFTTRIIVKASGIEYHTPIFIFYADWKHLNNLGYINDKNYGKTLVVVPRDGNLTLRTWAIPFRKVLRDTPQKVKILVAQFRQSNGHSFEEVVLANVSQYTGFAED